MHSKLWEEAHYQDPFPPNTLSITIFIQVHRVSCTAVFFIMLLLYNTVIELLLSFLLLTEAQILKARINSIWHRKSAWWHAEALDCFTQQPNSFQNMPCHTPNQFKQTCSSLASWLNMENTEQFIESVFSAVEDFLLTLSAKTVHFSQDNIMNDKLPCVFWVMLYVFEVRLGISGANGNREPQSHHRETSDASEWYIKLYYWVLLMETVYINRKVFFSLRYQQSHKLVKYSTKKMKWMPTHTESTLFQMNKPQQFIINWKRE